MTNVNLKCNNCLKLYEFNDKINPFAECTYCNGEENRMLWYDDDDDYNTQGEIFQIMGRASRVGNSWTNSLLYNAAIPFAVVSMNDFKSLSYDDINLHTTSLNNPSCQ